MKLIRDAALRGSVQAQYYLGSVAEQGVGQAPDPERARRYYRLCAAARNSTCQFKLGQMLLARENRQEHYYVQGIAWLELASEQGSGQAKALLDKERPTLSPTQIEWVQKLKPQLTQKP